MKGSIVKYVLRISLTLLAITALVAAALAGVNAITADRIAQIKQEKVQNAIAQVLPNAQVYGQAKFFEDATGFVKTIYESDKGFAVEVVPAGFGGGITMMVGVTQDGKVSGIVVISHTETAGLGSVAGANNAAGEAFRNQFVGTSDTLAVDKDGGTIDSITSATITSRAVVAGVNAALEAVKNLGKGGTL